MKHQHGTNNTGNLSGENLDCYISWMLSDDGVDDRLLSVVHDEAVLINTGVWYLGKYACSLSCWELQTCFFCILC